MYLTLRTGAALALLSLVAPAQSTIIVDINNGPGTNFTAIQPAIDAAAPGDVIVVRTGAYQAFTLTKGVALVAEQFTSADGASVVRNVPAGETASFVNIFLGTLSIRDCDGLVLDLRCPRLPLRCTGRQGARDALGALDHSSARLASNVSPQG